jgi:hypothetical protein
VQDISKERTEHFEKWTNKKKDLLLILFSSLPFVN